MSVIVQRRAEDEQDALAVANGMEGFGVDVFCVMTDRYGTWHVWGKGRESLKQDAMDRAIEKQRSR
jgi:hypothetical protein